MTVRCKRCELVQFMTVSGKCRRCREQLNVPPPVVIPPPEPVYAGEPLERLLTVGDVLRFCRLAAGLSQTGLQLRLTEHPFRTWISRVERNKVLPKPQSVYRYAQAFGVSPYFMALMLDVVYEQVPVTRFVASHQSQDPRATISSEEKTT